MKNNISLSEALWIDCETDEERAAFLTLGRGHQTGIIALSIQNEVAMAFTFRAGIMKERREAPAPQPCAAEGGLRAACEESLAGWKTVYSISSDLVVRDFANANIHTLEAALRAQQKEGV